MLRAESFTSSTNADRDDGYRRARPAIRADISGFSQAVGAVDVAGTFKWDIPRRPAAIARLGASRLCAKR